MRKLTHLLYTKHLNKMTMNIQRKSPLPFCLHSMGELCSQALPYFPMLQDVSSSTFSMPGPDNDAANNTVHGTVYGSVLGVVQCSIPLPMDPQDAIHSDWMNENFCKLLGSDKKYDAPGQAKINHANCRRMVIFVAWKFQCNWPDDVPWITKGLLKVPVSNAT